MKRNQKTRETFKIADVMQELSLSEGEFFRLLGEVKIRLTEGQKNLDGREVASLRQRLNEKRRREEARSQTVALPSIMRVQELATALQVPVGEVLSALLKNGVIATLNNEIDYDTAAIIATDLGYNTQEDVGALERDSLTPEKLDEILKKEDPAEQIVRPPVVTIMGHVDHGKTTLLDAIRSANVAAKEAGGITQAISSYQAEYHGRTITFIDTPGHETFTFMRKRGASLADIAVLVVAADDGVKPQTKEAVSHALAAQVPIIVAINKIDKAGANIEKTKTELAQLGLNPEEWGGKTVVVPLSALTKQGIPELLEMILLTADLVQPKANPNRPALGSIVESYLDKNVGPIAVALVHTGTLKTGDNVVIGRVAGRLRRLLDFRGRHITLAGPSTPVTLVGLEAIPAAGDVMQVVEAREEARLKAHARRAPVKTLSKADENDVRPVLPLVIKADSQGSLEALQQVITALVPPEVRLSVVRADVGSVSDSDILTAQAGGALIYAFKTRFVGTARRLAEKEKVTVKFFDVIYHLIENIKHEIEARLPWDIVRHEQGRLKVLKVFFSIQQRKIIGGEIAEGAVAVGDHAIIWRKAGPADREKIGQGKIIEMQKEKRAIEQAAQGDQVGLTYQGKGKIKAGDVLEFYHEEKVRHVAPSGESK